jgi:CHAT domain-containing protein/Tfp pilus assembly protein PilF
MAETARHRTWIVRLLAVAAACTAHGAASAVSDPQVPAPLQARLDAVRGLLDRSDYAAARGEAEAIERAVEAEYGPSSLEAASALALAAEARWRAGDSGDETRRVAERAIALQERFLGPDAPDLARTLTLLGHLLDEEIDYAGAKRAFERAIAIREKAFGASDPRTARSHGSLALELKAMGDFGGARAEYERALAILDASPQPDDETLAGILNNYALLFRDTGELERAARMQGRAVQSFERLLGRDDPQVATAVNNQASLYRMMGRYEEAVPLYERALALRTRRLGPEHPHLATTQHQLGETLIRLGRVDEGMRLVRRAIEIQEKAEGPDHPDVAVSLSTLAEGLERTGDLRGAQAAAERVVAIWERRLGPEHPDLADSLERLARYARARGEAELAVRTALRAEAISRSFLRLLARTLPEEEALRFASTRGAPLDIALAAAEEGLPADLRSAVWDSVVRTRALIFEEIAARRQSLRAAADPEVRPLWERFVASRRALMDRIVRGPGERPPAEGRQLVAEAWADSERAEEALIAASAVFGRDHARSALGLEEVRSSLSPGSALVSYVLYGARRRARREARPALGAPGRSSYVAFVMTSAGSTSVPIGPAEEIDALVRAWRDGILQGPKSLARAESSYERAGAALRRRIWDPIAAQVEGARRVYVVPDGALDFVSFASLPLSRGRYLIEEEPLIHLFSSERDLVPWDGRQREGRGLLALGDPAYDDASLFAALGGARPSEQAREAAERGQSGGCLDFPSVRFTPLAGTRREIAEVAEVLREAGGPDAQHLVARTGAAASETALKAEAPGRRILHLATHGLFLNGSCEAGPQAARGIGGLAPAGSEARGGDPDPLRLSGLALAGANHRAAAAAGEDDGILTAEEIASLDLAGVEWAVLSACETGLGTVERGEGVLGLSRALRLAGARTTILSLWPVDDAATRRFMSALYTAHWIDHRTTAEALREAGLAVLHERRRAGRSAHPFYWAGFVAVGDWR